jgi:hypothetical protein
MIRYFLAKGDRAGSATITEGLEGVTCSNPPPRVQIATLYMKTHCLKGRTGIVFFYGYWRQDGDSGDDLSGGHIDLWNKDTLTPSAESFLRFRIGVPRIPNPISWLRGQSDNIYSDLGKSRQILFWEVQ